MAGAADADEDQSLAVKLLVDIQSIFAAWHTSFISSKDLVGELLEKVFTAEGITVHTGMSADRAGHDGTRFTVGAGGRRQPPLVDRRPGRVVRLRAADQRPQQPPVSAAEDLGHQLHGRGLC